MTKRLLVTADDFGMCRAVNEGIVRAITRGIVRSTNFLVPCPWFGDALALAREHGLRVGVHLCLTCEWDRLRWGPLTRAESLTAPDGNFHQSYAELETTARDEDIRREAVAQIERVKALGYEPTHLDSHMLGSFASGTFAARIKDIHRELAAQYGLPYTYDTAAGRLVHFTAEYECSPHGVEETWRALEGFLDDGTYHLIGHAAVPSPELDALCSPAHPARAWAAPYRLKDLELFTDPRTSERLRDLGFELIGVDALG